MAQVVPPDLLRVLFHVTRMRNADVMRDHGRSQHGAFEIGQRCLAAVGANVDAEQQILH